MKSKPKTKKNKKETADELAEAIGAFMNGMASPESLYVINKGTHIVLRELIESGQVSPNNEYVTAFLDLYQQDMIATRTMIMNKKIGTA